MTDEAPEQPEQIELLGTAEVAALLGIAKSSVADRRCSPIFPKPAAELACGAIWTRAQIDEYRRRWVRGKHGMTYIWEEKWGKGQALLTDRPRLSGAELYPWAQSPESGEPPAS